MTITLDLPEHIVKQLLNLPEAERNRFALDRLASDDDSSQTAVVSTDSREARACLLASEPAIARLWDTPEEDEAWAHL